MANDHGGRWIAIDTGAAGAGGDRTRIVGVWMTMGEKAVLVFGSRHWGNARPIRAALYRIVEVWEPPITVINGGAHGADRLAAEIATDLRMDVKTFMAHWEEFGPSAGPRRNQEMLEYLLRFDERRGVGFRAGGVSRGTDDMARRLAAANVETWIYHWNEGGGKWIQHS